MIGGNIANWGWAIGDENKGPLVKAMQTLETAMSPEQRAFLTETPAEFKKKHVGAELVVLLESYCGMKTLVGEVVAKLATLNSRHQAPHAIKKSPRGTQS